jgi:hypothetical protein
MSRIIALFTILTAALAAAAEPSAPVAALETCNVVWNSPSQDARGSMPIGNGDIGLNAWVEPSGDLCFFIGKTDAWDENMRLLKLNKVRVRFVPALDTGAGFRWELKLHEGVMTIHSKTADVRVWVDANHPVVQVEAQAPNGGTLAATVRLEPWRLAKRPLGAPQGGGNNEYFSTGYTSMPAFSYPDTMLPHQPAQIGWHHRNLVSPWLESLKLQKLEALARTEQDPLLNRTCGGIVRGDGLLAVSDTELKSAKAVPALAVRIHLLTQITETPEAWLAALEKQADAVEGRTAAERWQAHEAWWAAFWGRSWIFAHSGAQPQAMPANAHPWRAGMDSAGGSRFGGSIAGPLVLGHALAPAEIARLAAVPRPEETAIRGAGESGTAGCTVAAWIKPAGGESGRILDKCTAGRPDGITFDAYPGLSLRWIVGDTTMVAPGCLKAGEWQHAAATVDAATGIRRLYLNGNLLKEESGDPAAAAISRGYTLQRWLSASGGRGAFPIKFNGSIFTVDNRFDADYRAWGGGYWWQNTRHSYWPMLEAGDTDLIRPLFDMYMKALPGRQLATKTYYGHDGAFYPETQSFWGAYLDQGDLGYGTDRRNKPDGLTDNAYIRRYWQGGLEITTMMLDYDEINGDPAFLKQTLVPFATAILTFYDQHWKRGPNGKILFDPAQSLETWHGAIDPLPEIVGLRHVITRFQAATGTNAFQKTLDDLPAVPLSPDGKRFLPAAKYWAKSNVENPELYGVFPYRVYTLAAGAAALQLGRNTYAVRGHRDNYCWRQDPIQAALLGLTDEAQALVAARPGRIQPGFRFPAMWDAGSDWVPDVDHAGVMQTAFQYMLLQFEGDKILLLPAWPKAWDVSFKLLAPRQTTIECEVRGGKLVKLKVQPAGRRKDVVVVPPFSAPVENQD